MKGGDEYNGDKESPGKKSEKDFEEEITYSATGSRSSPEPVNLRHEEGLRGFVFFAGVSNRHVTSLCGEAPRRS